MEESDPRRYVYYTAIAKNIVSNLAQISEKYVEICNKNAIEYENAVNQVKSAKDIAGVFSASKKLREVSENVVSNFSILDRVQTIIKRNEDRVKYYQSFMKNEGIMNFDVSKKMIDDVLNEKEITIADKYLGINKPVGGVKFILVNGVIFRIRNGNLLVKDNFKALCEISDSDFSFISGKHPEMLMSASGENLLNHTLKNRIIKQVAVLGDIRLKDESIADFNKYLGSPLILAGVNIETISDYVEKIKNLLDCRSKKYLLDTYPNFTNLIMEKLVCNDEDDTIPEMEKIYKEDYEPDLYEEESDEDIEDILDEDAEIV